MSPCSLKDSFKSLNFLFWVLQVCSGFGDLCLFLRSHDSWEKWGKLYPFHLGEIMSFIFYYIERTKESFTFHYTFHMEKVPKVRLSSWKKYLKLYIPHGKSTESYTFRLERLPKAILSTWEKAPKAILSTWKKYRKLSFPLGKSTESYSFHLKKKHWKLYFTLGKRAESYTFLLKKSHFSLGKSTESYTFHFRKELKVVLSTWGKSTESHNFHLGKAPKVILLASEWESTERLPLLMNGMRQSSNQALSLVDSIKCRQIGGKWCSFVGDLNWTLLTRPAVSWTKVIRKIAVELEICVRELLVLGRQPHG